MATYLLLYIMCFAVQFAIIFGMVNGTCRNIDKKYHQPVEKMDRQGWLFVWVASAIPILGFLATIGGSLPHIDVMGFSWRNGK